METQINKFSIAVLESIFRSMQDAGHRAILDASVYLYNFVSKEGTFSSEITDGFYSVMMMLSEISADEFWQLKSVFA